MNRSTDGPTFEMPPNRTVTGRIFRWVIAVLTLLAVCLLAMGIFTMTDDRVETDVDEELMLPIQDSPMTVEDTVKGTGTEAKNDAAERRKTVKSDNGTDVEPETGTDVAEDPVPEELEADGDVYSDSMESEMTVETEVQSGEELPAQGDAVGSYTAADLRDQGRIYDNYEYTWYSQRVLPGGGLDIPGRHVNDEGFVCDGDGNIVVASVDYGKGTKVATPWGDAVVYDTGYLNSGQLDVYTDW